MSEYQSYEFVAIDRQLTGKQMAELRSISTRAEITPTRFWNEYTWGDLKADAGKLLARYFDAHLYVASWGAQRFMLRLPARSVDFPRLKPYFPGPRARLTKSGTFLVLDFWSNDDDSDEDWPDAPRLATLIPIRSQLLQGDLRAAYIAWLCNVQAGELEDDQHEPPVPVGLSEAPAPLASLVKLLRLDPDLLSAAAESSDPGGVSSNEVHTWIKTRPPVEKDRWLLRAVDRPESALGTELLAAFQRERLQSPKDTRRTVAELRARTESVRSGGGAGVVRVNGRRGVPGASVRGSRALTWSRRGRAQGRRATAR